MRTYTLLPDRVFGTSSTFYILKLLVLYNGLAPKMFEYHFLLLMFIHYLGETDF